MVVLLYSCERPQLTEKLCHLAKFNTKTKMGDKQNYILKESQLLLMTVSKLSKYNMVTLIKQFNNVNNHLSSPL